MLLKVVLESFFWQIILQIVTFLQLVIAVCYLHLSWLLTPQSNSFFLDSIEIFGLRSNLFLGIYFLTTF